MSSISNIAVYDGAATPVLHTLNAISVVKEGDKITAFYREDLANVPVYAQVRATLTLQALKSGVYRVEQMVEVPAMEVTSGQNAAGYTAAPKIAYINTVRLTGTFHERSDSGQRRLVRQMAINLAGNISTSVAPSTAGPVRELFDLLVAPA